MQKSLSILFLLTTTVIICCKKSDNKPTYTITATSGSNGRIAPYGITKVKGGSEQSYYIIPDDGYGVASLMVDSKSVDTTTLYTFTNISANHTIDVAFAKAYTITVVIDSNGSVVPASPITSIVGSSLLLTFLPRDGYHTDTIWLDGVPKSLDGQTTYTVDNIKATHTLRVTFVNGLTNKELTALKLLIAGKWKTILIENKWDTPLSPTWEPYTMSPCEIDDYEIYGGGPDFKYTAYQNGTFCPGRPTEIYDAGTWSLSRDGKQLTLSRPDGSHASIDLVSVTADELVTIFHAANGVDLYRYTEVH